MTLSDTRQRLYNVTLLPQKRQYKQRTLTLFSKKRQYEQRTLTLFPQKRQYEQRYFLENVNSNNTF